MITLKEVQKFDTKVRGLAELYGKYYIAINKSHLTSIPKRAFVTDVDYEDSNVQLVIPANCGCCSEDYYIPIEEALNLKTEIKEKAEQALKKRLEDIETKKKEDTERRLKIARVVQERRKKREEVLAKLSEEDRNAIEFDEISISKYL